MENIVTGSGVQHDTRKVNSRVQIVDRLEHDEDISNRDSQDIPEIQSYTEELSKTPSKQNVSPSDKIYDNYFIQFGSGYIFSRFILSHTVMISLIFALLTVILIKGSLYLIRRSRSRGNSKIESFYLSPEALEGYLLTETRSVNIEFNEEDSYFQVMVE